MKVTVLGRAIALAADIHKDDLYGDDPYIFHLLQVLKTVENQNERMPVKVAAILHDALEDHPECMVRVVEFLQRNEPAIGTVDSVLNILKHVTRHYHGQETYNEFIDRVCKHRDSCVVKLADLQRNAAPKKRRRSEKHMRLALERYIPAMAKVTHALLVHEREVHTTLTRKSAHRGF